MENEMEKMPIFSLTLENPSVSYILLHNKLKGGCSTEIQNEFILSL